MTEEQSRFARVADLFKRAREMPVHERSAFLRAECGDDSAMIDEVEQLLMAEGAPTPFSSLAGEVEGMATALREVSGPREEQPGDTIGAYTIRSKLGEGGFGVVFAADQSTPIRRTVALKVIKLGMDTRQVMARFGAERQALAMMDHPSIAKVFDAGATESGRPYFVMELVEGTPITAYCDAKKLDASARLRLFVRVCQAVQHAHQKGQIHRDIKPSNVLVTEVDGEAVPKVIDFGIAKATESHDAERTVFTEQGQMIGTPEYMSPEQAGFGAADVDTRSDIYSLGVLLYELLTGSTPFEKERLRSAAFAEVQRIIREEEPQKPSTRVSGLGETAGTVAEQRGTEPGRLSSSVRGDLDWIVMKALEKQRERRYDSASALMEDIDRHLSSQPVLAGPPSASYRIKKFARRHRAAMVGVGVLIVGTVVGTAGLGVGFVNAARQRDRAEAARIETQAALEEAAAVRDFLVDMITSVDPSIGDKDVTVREVLDEASAKIEGSFDQSPGVEGTLQLAIGTSYAALGLRAAAEEHVLRALELAVDTVGADHPETVALESDLAELYRRQARFDEAEPLFERVIAFETELYGADDPRTLETMGGYGGMLNDAQRFEEAEPYLRDLLERAEGRDDVSDDYVLLIKNNLASVYLDTGRYAQAEPLFEEIVSARVERFGESHPNTITARVNLAAVYGHQKKHDKSLPIMLRNLEVSRETYGDEHPDTLVQLNNLAAQYREMGEAEKALPIAGEALAVFRALEGDEHPGTLALMNNLAGAYQSLGRFEEAQPIIEEAVGLAERGMGADDWRTNVLRTKLGIGYVQLERFEEAERELLRAHAAIAGHLGGENRFARQTAAELVRLYEAWDRPVEAGSWRAKTGVSDSAPEGP